MSFVRYGWQTHEGRRLTRLDHVCELLPDGEEQDLLPRLLGLVLRHAESPRTALYIAGVLPDGLDAALEEVHGVFHLEPVEREAIVRFPEGLERDDVLEE